MGMRGGPLCPTNISPSTGETYCPSAPGIPCDLAALAASSCAEAKGTGLGLFEEVGDFGEECWEVVFDGGPEEVVSDVVVFVGDDVSQGNDFLVVCDLACEVLVVLLESVCGFADDDE